MSTKVVLCLTSHCDDAELFAGGTILKYCDNGYSVVIGIDQHDEIRKEEATRGADLVGCQLISRNLGMEKSDWIRDLLETLKPLVLFTHSSNDPHIDHQRTYNATLEALTRFDKRKMFPTRWYCLDTYYATMNQPCWPMLIDVTDYFEKKLAALRCFKSQDCDWLIKTATNMAAIHGQRIRVSFAEAFYPFTILGRLPVFRTLP